MREDNQDNPLPIAGKIARDEGQAQKIEEQYKDRPHGWVQWKGTDVCMDVHCACGYLGHVDADFAYNVECPSCHRIYRCNGHIELIELEIKPDWGVVLAD